MSKSVPELQVSTSSWTVQLKSFSLLPVLLVVFSIFWESLLFLKCTLIFLIHRSRQFCAREVWLDLYSYTCYSVLIKKSPSLFCHYREFKLSYHPVTLFMVCPLELSLTVIFHISISLCKCVGTCLPNLFTLSILRQGCYMPLYRENRCPGKIALNISLCIPVLTFIRQHFLSISYCFFLKIYSSSPISYIHENWTLLNTSWDTRWSVNFFEHRGEWIWGKLEVFELSVIPIILTST